MNYRKYMNDLLQYRYLQGESEDLEDVLLIAA